MLTDEIRNRLKEIVLLSGQTPKAVVYLNPFDFVNFCTEIESPTNVTELHVNLDFTEVDVYPHDFAFFGEPVIVPKGVSLSL